MSISPLRADVFTAPAISAVPPVPIPHNIPPLWSPTTATLISSAHSTVLVDPLFTTSQSLALSDWIADLLYPDKQLTHIYITHGHGDHFFGLSTLFERFPNATAVATKGVLQHMEQQVSPSSQDFWHKWFPGDQIRFPTSPLPVTVLPAHNLTVDLDGHTLHAVPAGHADTDDSTFLWVPDLRLVVAGDIVYNGVYQYLAESLTPALREQWIHAVQKIKSYHPETVVTGHKRPGAADGAWTLDATERYLRLWGDLVERATGARDLFDKVRAADPGKIGDFVLWWSCLQQFPGNGTSEA